MTISPAQVLVGYYQYTYPTFTDSPQFISVHFLTPDGQQAFVSYPDYRGRKAGKLIPIDWFQSVNLLRLEGQPQLMYFLAMLFTGWFDRRCTRLQLSHRLLNKLDQRRCSQALVA